MDYLLTEEQQMIKDLCRQIAEEKIKPAAAEYDESGARTKRYATLPADHLPVQVADAGKLLSRRTGGKKSALVARCRYSAHVFIFGQLQGLQASTTVEHDVVRVNFLDDDATWHFVPDGIDFLLAILAAGRLADLDVI